MEKHDILWNIEALAVWSTFSDVSMSQIAERLWIKKASIYYYFPSKNDLQKEVIDYSFQKYKYFIEELFEHKSKKKIIEWFLDFAKKEKNLFIQINQNWYCSNEEIINDIAEKNKQIFKIVRKLLEKNFNFSKEKSFLFFSILQDICIKKCIFWECEIKQSNLIDEMTSIF